ncbi:MAG TPA: transglutaminase-like cysteine peptidase [Rhizobiaceae bacterium]|nr:transglutaminase-like cysteine peptidase [Rhizobiaceae bacterium]
MAAWRGVFRKTVALGLLSGLWLTGSASASSFMVTGGVTSQPIGHYDLCKKMPAECLIRSRNQRPEKMSPALLRLITDVNLAVNRAVKPVNDIEIFGRDEVWAYPVNGIGDCEDYVLEKRRRLMKSGLSVANLLITVVRKPDGEGHAVLTVRTDKGDYILDNLTSRVALWNNTNYRFLKRQASFDSGRWVTLREDNNLLVGAVKN